MKRLTKLQRLQVRQIRSNSNYSQESKWWLEYLVLNGAPGLKLRNPGRRKARRA